MNKYQALIDSLIITRESYNATGDKAVAHILNEAIAALKELK